MSFDKPILFGKKAAERTKAAVIVVEKGLKGADPRQNNWPRLLGGGGMRLAITNGIISARVGTAPGSGSVFLVDDSTGTLVTTTVTQAVSHIGSTTGGIATGTYVEISVNEYGNWYISAIDCGN